MKKIIAFICLSVSLFAITPFSLEGLKDVNVYVWDKRKALSKEYTQQVKKDVEALLKKNGLNITSNHYSNFLITIEVLKVNDLHAVNVDLSIGEDTLITERKPQIDAIGNTYQMNTLFKAKNLEADISKKIFEKLLKKFIEQYKDENL